MADELVRVDPSAPSELARLELSQARARLAHATRALKADLAWLKVPAKVTASVNKHPLLWVGGAFLLGGLLGALSNGFPRRDDNGSE
jgi:hypothetical protein